MDICPMCALTGRITEVQTLRIAASANLSASVDWYCPSCRTFGHHPELDAS